ncbi:MULTISPECIES: MBL fold metallo-hydrolase [Sphingobacterium]|uniref:MBL fold metallo-hydrolase n=1 Tax=Sphingobacterium TaxID=28453 RepID=UPI001047BA75|nr:MULTISPECIES: MBL fold metallo-hydrolase [Sphingobacterium]MCW2263476.1 L-ascorbate metabolism protein UlaG (beta-lactamase superfamily) [Sphingobacterium kitahiroshimense]TCR05910.1 L-ascorbate metabolism protein UlaG (beta-lactamase superfamily) [Sphingobacterium sp. JUb78]
MKKIILGMAFTMLSAFSFAQINPDTKQSVQLIRNATLLIEYGGKKILVDPMFSPKGTIDSWAGIQKNPTVELKIPIEEIVKDVDLVLVSHSHEDHFDKFASQNLDKSIDLIMQPADIDFFKKENFTNAAALEGSKVWDGITIHRTEGQHGSGEVLKMMGKTSGFVLQAENQPTVYIVGDAIWTEDIKKTIKKFKPDYIIVNSGGALVQGFENLPIIMDEAQTMELIKNSGKAKVIAVHMEALDHCRTTRSSLKKKATELKIGTDKLMIPEDGEMIKLSN